MSKKSIQKLLGVASILIIAGTIMELFVIPYYDLYSDSWVSASIEESRSKGIFIQEIKVEPQSFFYKGDEIVVKEAWLEYHAKLKFHFWFFPKWKRLDAIIVCFTLEDFSRWKAYHPLDFATSLDCKAVNVFGQVGMANNSKTIEIIFTEYFSPPSLDDTLRINLFKKHVKCELEDDILFLLR